MRRTILYALCLLASLSCHAQQTVQRVLSLDSCRVMALAENKQLKVARLQQNVASDVKKAARTHYLPKVDAVGGYMYMNREVSILNDEQKNNLNNLGTNLLTKLGSSGMSAQLAQILTQMGLNPTAALPALTSMLNGTGQQVTDAFRTDTRNMWGGSVMVRQPLYMGGAIRAADRMASIAGDMADVQLQNKEQDLLYDVDKVYWLIVSLRQKQRLAESYRDLVLHLDDDVRKMVEGGVATKADGLKVDVSVNEAEMKLTEAENGLALSRMLLCQLCGMPEGSEFELEDEVNDNVNDNVNLNANLQSSTDPSLRPELRLLESAVDLGKASEKLVLSAYLPHAGVVGGYAFSNPNVFNGFEKKVAGFWNVGVMVHVPVWNWMESKYKVRAAKNATAIAQTTLEEAREKVDLQVSQCRFKVTEAEKRLVRARKNTESATENLRCAEAGFKEGVMDATTVMQAQTAWQQAESQRIDAEIDVHMTNVALQKALGTLR